MVRGYAMVHVPERAPYPAPPAAKQEPEYRAAYSRLHAAYSCETKRTPQGIAKSLIDLSSNSAKNHRQSGSGAGEGSRTLDILLGKYKQLATKLHFVAKESVHIVPQRPYCLSLLSGLLSGKFESPRPQLTAGISSPHEL